MLIEFLVSLAFAAAFAYFAFLSGAPNDTTGDSRSGARRNASALRAGSSHTSPAKVDTTLWLHVVQRWLAAVVLGGGTQDPALWSNRTAYAVDVVLREIGAQLLAATQRHGAPSPARPAAAGAPPLRVHHLTLGRCVHPNTPPLNPQPVASSDDDVTLLSNVLHSRNGGTGVSSSSAGALSDTEAAAATRSPSSSSVRTPLPSLEVVASRTYTAMESFSGSALREVRLKLGYDDPNVLLHLRAELPLLLGLPKNLCIPPDLLTAKCRAEFRRVCFGAQLCLRFMGMRVEFFFEAPPTLDADIALGVPHPRATAATIATEDKAGELLMLALRRALASLVFPSVLVMQVHASPTLHVTWSRETLDCASS